MSSGENHQTKFLVIAVVALFAIAAVLSAFVRGLAADAGDGNASMTSSTVSHAFKYETLAPGTANLPAVPIEEELPYRGYGHGLATTPETDSSDYADYSGKDVAFSKESGAYAEAFQLSLRAPEGYTIRYTLDGSEPTELSAQYTRPIILADADGEYRFLSSPAGIAPTENYDFPAMTFYPDQSKLARATIVKAKAFSEDGRSTDTVTKTYFIGKSIAERYGGIAVMSITANQADLLDYENGIMASGKLYDQWRATPEAQSSIASGLFWDAVGNYSMKGSDWEREATMELFDGTDSLSYSSGIGIRIRGNTSRSYSQKSLNVYFRKAYGSKTMDYALFDSAFDADGNTISQYKSFMLRNGGTEALFGLKFRDAYLQSMLTGMNFATQSSRPCVVFLNGEYWGVYSLQEKYSDDQVSAEYGVDKDNVVIVKNGMIDEGIDSDIDLYDELCSYAEADLADPAVWKSFSNTVDVQSMADYFAAEVYVGTADWGQQWNYALWRTRFTENEQYGDGRWRWMVYDLDFSTARVYHDGANVLASYDHLFDAMKNNDLFASAMRNPDFRAMFRSSLETVANNKLEYGRSMSRLMDHIDVWEPLLPDMYARYGDFGKSMYRRGISKLADYIETRASCLFPIVDEAYADFDEYCLRVQEAKEAESEEQQAPHEFESGNLPDEIANGQVQQGGQVLPVAPGLETDPGAEPAANQVSMESTIADGEEQGDLGDLPSWN